MTDDAREAAARLVTVCAPLGVTRTPMQIDAYAVARALLLQGEGNTAHQIAAIVETYTDILSPETARKVASRIRALPGGVEGDAGEKAITEAIKLMDQIGRDWKADGQMQKFYATNYLVEAIRPLLKSGKEQE